MEGRIERPVDGSEQENGAGKRMGAKSREIPLKLRWEDWLSEKQLENGFLGQRPSQENCVPVLRVQSKDALKSGIVRDEEQREWEFEVQPWYLRKWNDRKMYPAHVPPRPDQSDTPFSFVRPLTYHHYRNVMQSPSELALHFFSFLWEPSEANALL